MHPLWNPLFLSYNSDLLNFSRNLDWSFQEPSKENSTVPFLPKIYTRPDHKIYTGPDHRKDELSELHQLLVQSFLTLCIISDLMAARIIRVIQNRISPTKVTIQLIKHLEQIIPHHLKQTIPRHLKQTIPRHLKQTIPHLPKMKESVIAGALSILMAPVSLAPTGVKQREWKSRMGQRIGRDTRLSTMMSHHR